MTQPGTLSVEYDELMARAAELEEPIPGMPTGNPAAPCNLGFVRRAAQQIGLSADNMRTYLGVGERERSRLAQSLRNAAKAYEEADEGAEEAIADETSVSPVQPGPVRESVDPATLDETPVAAMAGPGDYADLKQRTLDNETGDQGTAFLRFADAWESYQRALLEARYRFRPFKDWWSPASDAVEANFDSQRSWLDSMATLCGQLATQARGVASTQRWAQKEHIWYNNQTIKYKDFAELDQLYNSQPMFRDVVMQIYGQLQTKSDEVMLEYEKRAALPLPPLSPPKPTPAYRIDPPPEPKPSDPDNPADPTNPGDGGDRVEPDNPVDTDPETGLPLDDSELPDPTGMPATPSAGMPTTPTDPQLTQALKDLKGKPGLPAGAGVKPASVGGAGAGGVPAMPLQAPVDAESASRPAGAAGPSAAGPGRGVPGVGGAGGGMAPMGAPGAGQGQGNNKGKRTQSDDEALYTEERPWTEGVIGRRRAKDAPDK
ncbi:PPE domain-containing protein [Mycobacterium parmense]|uniref:ESX-1 secretion-associated protein EspB n=1 Tax=Mycobacterium parmense TaxID=185642 RepID=A0A7I7Z0I9_9MYCO|nr:hypothetical protein [Mycobacterium parmense]MCV7352736.1 hypothetical protein [Mycobacterium parmense]ORW54647.1 hypothetical protein AWC20_19325 [Mycobacterium parmense]BBZ46744.1 ESX-1 secretion-associated protein EspB [Mycobacterium parmense]